jgi:hypothetical protein
MAASLNIPMLIKRRTITLVMVSGIHKLTLNLNCIIQFNSLIEKWIIQ